MKHQVLLAAVVLCSTPLVSIPLRAQEPAKKDPAHAEDPHGMRIWQLAMLRRGPAYATLQGEKRAVVMQGHMDNIRRLARLGKLRLAGPFSVPKDAGENAFAGLFLLDVETQAEALELCRTDPSIVAKLFEVEMLTWYGPSDITYRGDLAAAGDTTPLFNRVDLAGWHTDIPKADDNPDLAPSFVVRDGLLVSQGRPEGHLITDASFRDYRLVVEYRWPDKPGNCGVLVHASVPRRLYGMFPQSIECQMHHTNAGDFWCIGEDITVPDMVERRGAKAEWGVDGRKRRRIANLTDDSEKPLQEWNQMVIECRGRNIDVWVNGDHVNSGHDCTADHGQIAIQAEGAVCEFRKVELTRLVK